jgi:hypothetical protein
MTFTEYRRARHENSASHGSGGPIEHRPAALGRCARRVVPRPGVLPVGRARRYRPVASAVLTFNLRRVKALEYGEVFPTLDAEIFGHFSITTGSHRAPEWRRSSSPTLRSRLGRLQTLVPDSFPDEAWSTTRRLAMFRTGSEGPAQAEQPQNPGGGAKVSKNALPVRPGAAHPVPPHQSPSFARSAIARRYSTPDRLCVLARFHCIVLWSVS